MMFHYLFYLNKFGYYMYEKKVLEGTFKNITHSSKLAICSSFTSIENCNVDKNNIFTEIIIPDIINDIGRESFSQCWNLKQIFIPYSVNIIGEFCFGLCINLEEIIFGYSGSLNIQKYAFYNCRSLKKIILPPCMTSIDNGCFCNCIQLENISIPDSVKTIENAAFYGCSSLFRR